MITATKTILGLSALALAGAWTVVGATTPARLQLASPATMANGKIIDRAPMVDSPLTNEQILIRIRSAHGLPTGVKLADVDCKQFAWPNIPSECIVSEDGAARRQVRVISVDTRSSATPAATSPARMIR
jgi:hypothetical protein